MVGAILLLRKVQSDEKSVAIENRQTDSDFFCVLLSSLFSFFSIIPQNSTNIIVMEGVKIPCISVDFLSLTACYITAYFTVYSASFILLDSLWFSFFFPWCAIQLNSNSIRGRFYIFHYTPYNNLIFMKKHLRWWCCSTFIHQRFVFRRVRVRVRFTLITYKHHLRQRVVVKI